MTVEAAVLLLPVDEAVAITSAFLSTSGAFAMHAVGGGDCCVERCARDGGWLAVTAPGPAPEGSSSAGGVSAGLVAGAGRWLRCAPPSALTPRAGSRRGCGRRAGGGRGGSDHR